MTKTFQIKVDNSHKRADLRRKHRDSGRVVYFGNQKIGFRVGVIAQIAPNVTLLHGSSVTFKNLPAVQSWTKQKNLPELRRITGTYENVPRQ